MNSNFVTPTRILAAVTLGLLAYGCGQSSPNTSAVTTATTNGTGCVSGSVYTAYGCLTQGSCSAGYGAYNGTCVPATSYVGGTSGCIALNQSIPFSGSGLQLDTGSNIYGGAVPSYGAIGTMTVGTAGAISGQTYSSVSNGSTYSVGTFQMSVQGANGTTYGYGSTANVSGVLTIGPYYQQLIQSSVASSYGYGTSTSTAACVSGIALAGHLYSTGSYGFGGNVYLFLNGTQHGYVLQFQ